MQLWHLERIHADLANGDHLFKIVLLSRRSSITWNQPWDQSIQVQLCTRNVRVERPHRVYKALCIEFMKEFSEQWDAIAPHFVWVVRTTSKIYNGRYTPYEIITGMKPRLPLDAVLSTPTVVAKRSADDYVSDLVEYMKSVHKFVQDEHRRIREQERDRDIRKRDMARFKQGDYVFLKRPGLKPEPGHSRRFNSETDARLFQIIHAPATLEEARTVTLMEPATGKTQV